MSDRTRTSGTEEGTEPKRPSHQTSPLPPSRRNAHDAFTRPSPPPVTCDQSQLFAGISVDVWARI